MRLTVADIPRDELRNAPKVRQTNRVGASMFVRDPKWIRERLNRLECERSMDMPKGRPQIAPKRGERPDAVIRAMASAWALPEHLIRCRDQAYVQEAVVATALALRKRCPQLSRADIASLLGYECPTSISRLLSEKASKDWEGA